MESSRLYPSIYGDSPVGAGYARSMLDSAQAWNAKTNGAGEQWMRIDLETATRVSGVVIQARSDSDQYVTEVEVHHSNNVETNYTSLGRFPHISATVFLFCGMCMGVFTTGADLMGVIIFGTGISLSVTVIYYIHKLERNSWTVMQALPNNRY